MRRAAIAAFFCGLVLYPISFALTVNALEGEFAERSASPYLWLAGRSLAVAAIMLFAFSVVAAFFITARARTLWWVVPATVLAIVVVYFDLIGFGFRM